MKRHGNSVSSRIGRALCIALILACLCVANFAFTYSTATITGRVTDSSAAAIVGAKVEANNIDTNLTFSTVTNDEGIFVIPNLSPGRYRIFVRKDGFRTIVQTGVVLHVQDIASLSLSMEPGSVIQSVTIEGGAPLIQKESATVGTLVDRQFAENLPLNGRSFQSLITLTPGTVLTAATEGSPGQFSVNGQRANANYFTVDGVSANVGVSNTTFLFQSGGSTPTLSASGGTNSLVSVDALQEFKILTSTYAPEFGRTPGGQVQIITRSGTNRFTGTVFEYFRNDVLDANDWFTNALGRQKPALRQNDFGGVLGGPIIKNRTFFFFSYEGLRLRQPLTRSTDVPSLSTRQNAPTQIRPYLNAFPIPNGPDRVVGGAPNGLAEFSASFSNPSTLDATSIRIDHAFNGRLTLFGRYNYAPSGIDQRSGQFGDSLNTVAQTKLGTQTLTFGATQSFTPSLSNELRFNYSKSEARTFRVLDNFGGAIPLSESLLFPSFTSPQDSSFIFLINNGAGTSLRSGKAQKHTQDQVNIVNNLSLVAGAHQWKFGIDYRRVVPINGARAYQQTVESLSVAPLLTGRVSFVTVLQQQSNLGLVFNNFSAYGQDTWKLTPRLTLTYGSRWEVNSPPSVKNGEPPLAVTGMDNPATLTLAPRGTPLYRTTYNNFAPRLGMTYQLSRKQGGEMVLRGGFGIFYDLGNAAAGNILSSFPNTTRKQLTNVLFPLDEASARPAPFTTTPPVSSLFLGVDPNLKLPRTYQWNIALEQSLGASQTVSASYIAAVGRRLIRQESIFAPNQNFTSLVSLIKDIATSDYHAMQIQFTRRLSRGLQTLASYTWSHSIDEASGDASALGNDRVRGPSDFDIRHSFSSAITYNIPTISANAFGQAALGGWALDTIVVARSANPVNVIAGTLTLPSGDQLALRPNLIQGVPLYIEDQTAPGGKRINNTVPTATQVSAAGCRPITPTNARGAFCNPSVGLQGNLGRNALRGFSIWQADLALRRQFNLTERLNLQFRAEFFNVFNHPNFANPNGSLVQGTFGQSAQMFGSSLLGTGGVGLNPLYQVGGPRSIQLAMKIQF